MPVRPIPSVPDEKIETTKELIMEREGPENPISAREINEIIEVDSVGSFPRTREIISHLLINEEYPIVSSSKGYYIVISKDDRERYIESIEDRAVEMLERKVAILRATENNDDWPPEEAQ